LQGVDFGFSEVSGEWVFWTTVKKLAQHGSLGEFGVPCRTNRNKKDGAVSRRGV